MTDPTPREAAWRYWFNVGWDAAYENALRGAGEWVESVEASEIRVGDRMWDDDFKLVVEIRDTDPNDAGPTIFFEDEGLGETYGHNEHVLRLAALAEHPHPSHSVPRQMDEPWCECFEEGWNARASLVDARAETPVQPPEERREEPFGTKRELSGDDK